MNGEGAAAGNFGDGHRQLFQPLGRLLRAGLLAHLAFKALTHQLHRCRHRFGRRAELGAVDRLDPPLSWAARDAMPAAGGQWGVVLARYDPLDAATFDTVVMMVPFDLLACCCNNNYLNLLTIVAIDNCW